MNNLDLLINGQVEVAKHFAIMEKNKAIGLRTYGTLIYFKDVCRNVAKEATFSQVFDAVYEFINHLLEGIQDSEVRAKFSKYSFVKGVAKYAIKFLHDTHYPNFSLINSCKINC
jgi:hypothetical protein